MDQAGDLFGRFKSAGPEKVSFFDGIQRSKDSQALRARIEDVLGPLPDSAFDHLKPLAERNFEQAIESFFEHGIPDREPAEPVVPTKPLNDIASAPYSAPATPPLSTSLASDEREERGDEKRDSPEVNSSTSSPVSAGEAQATNWTDNRRLIGSFQCDAWCTRSGRNLAKYGEALTVNRVPSSASQKQRDDIIVRFCNLEGLDFARSKEEDAKFMAVLIDSGVCSFEATVIFADTYLRLGSTVYVQVDCFLRRTAFASSSSSFGIDLGAELSIRPKKKKAIVDESKETQDERFIRLRQLALVNLFSRLGLTDSTPDMSRALSDMNAANNPPTSDEEPTELNQDQIDLFYKNTASSAKNIEFQEADPDDSFALDLFAYQKRGLAWMLQREQGAPVAAAARPEQTETHPLWTELRWPEGDPFWANLNSGELSLDRPTLESKSRGGILADEMGLGKTISMLALIHSGKNESRGHTTLVVAPMSLLSQWESETQKASKSPKSCGCLVYYGDGTSHTRDNLSMFLDAKVPARKVIVTSYGMVISEHKQRNLIRGTLFDHDFDRIILDEAHTIKNRSTQTAKACFDLKGHRRWVLTGTPVVNRLEDLYSLVRFIGVEPWQNFTFWRAFITEQFEKLDTRERAMTTVQAVISPICMRRTKSMKDPSTGRPLIELPTKVIEVKRIPFSQDEQVLYSHLYAQIRDSVQDRVLEGTAINKYSAILALLLRLRQVCCHPLLLKKSTADSIGATAADTKTGALEPSPDGPSAKRVKREADASSADLAFDLSTDIEQLLSKFSSTPSVEYTLETLRTILDKPSEEEECAICSEDQNEPVFMECLHSACRDCLMCHIDHLRKRGEGLVCHICRAPINISRLFVVDRHAKKLQPLNLGLQSSKVRALVSDLRQASANRAGKAVVFSQFTSFLDIIESNLKEAGFPVYRFDGSMSQTQRAVAVDQFKSETNDTAVFLLSLKAGGVGLNLVVAKHAYMMDPWWSYAVESQAIDRIHRMGQTDQVKITRFIIEGSIEERMLQIQERKRVLSRVVSDDERRMEQLENIKLLLDLPDIKDSSTASSIDTSTPQ